MGVFMLDANGNKIRVTRQLVVDSLKQALGYPNAEVVYFDDLKETTKHCCLGYAGILHLSLNYWTFSDEDGNIVVQYFFCTRCGKLLVYRDFM